MQASYDRYIGKSWLATLRMFREKPNYPVADKQTQIKHLEVFVVNSQNKNYNILDFFYSSSEEKITFNKNSYVL